MARKIGKALVVGAGIAGIQTALDIADAGYPVVLVERQPTLGGNVARLSGLYINLDPAVDLLNEKMQAVLAHPDIEVQNNPGDVLAGRDARAAVAEEPVLIGGARGAQVGVGNPDGTVTVDGGHADVSPVGLAQPSRTA